MTPSTQDARATGLVELAVRCEQATGADRELDREVSFLCQTTAQRRAMDEAEWPLPYTASLDAAMTLIDPLWGYEQRRPSDGSTQPCWAELWWVPTFPNKVLGFGQTPALALTAAALRALAASTKDMNHDG